MAPAVPDTFVPVAEEVKIIKFGVLKFARLSKLKISVRNWRASRSRRLVVLRAEKSDVANPGSIKVFRAHIAVEAAVGGRGVHTWCSRRDALIPGGS